MSAITKNKRIFAYNDFATSASYHPKCRSLSSQHQSCIESRIFSSPLSRSSTQPAPTCTQITPCFSDQRDKLPYYVQNKTLASQILRRGDCKVGTFVITTNPAQKNCLYVIVKLPYSIQCYPLTQLKDNLFSCIHFGKLFHGNFNACKHYIHQKTQLSCDLLPLTKEQRLYAHIGFIGQFTKDPIQYFNNFNDNEYILFKVGEVFRICYQRSHEILFYTLNQNDVLEIILQQLSLKKVRAGFYDKDDTNTVRSENPSHPKCFHPKIVDENGQVFSLLDRMTVSEFFFLPQWLQTKITNNLKRKSVVEYLKLQDSIEKFEQNFTINDHWTFRTLSLGKGARNKVKLGFFENKSECVIIRITCKKCTDLQITSEANAAKSLCGIYHKNVVHSYSAMILPTPNHIKRLYNPQEICALSFSKVMKKLYEEFIEYELNGATLEEYELHFQAKRFLILECVRAIYYLHQKHVYHRDLKSGNMMFTIGGYLKFIDFGVCTSDPYDKEIQGSFAYLSPDYIAEILSNKRTIKISHQDRWGIVISLAEMYMGPKRFYNKLLAPYAKKNAASLFSTSATNVQKFKHKSHKMLKKELDHVKGKSLPHTDYAILLKLSENKVGLEKLIAQLQKNTDENKAHAHIKGLVSMCL